MKLTVRGNYRKPQGHEPPGRPRLTASFDTFTLHVCHQEHLHGARGEAEGPRASAGGGHVSVLTAVAVGETPLWAPRRGLCRLTGNGHVTRPAVDVEVFQMKIHVYNFKYN